MDSFCADIDVPDKGHLGFVYSAKATTFVGCVVQSISCFNGLRSEKLKCSVCACLPGSPRHWTCAVALCQGKQPHLSLNATAWCNKREKGKAKKTQQTKVLMKLFFKPYQKKFFLKYDATYKRLVAIKDSYCKSLWMKVTELWLLNVLIA